LPKWENVQFKKMLEKFGIFLSIIINFANPETVVLCGGLSHAVRYFFTECKIRDEK
jgi:predicted NBD/HSP70 family sugar kinase